MVEQSKSLVKGISLQKRVSSETLANHVVAYLRDLIASQGMRPGARLPSEASISASLGISRPIVREALRTLAATGLIEMAVGKRATVSALGAGVLQNIIENAVLTGQADVWHVMEMRRGIEISMVALAAERCTAKRAAELSAIVSQMADKILSVKEYTALDMRFHFALAEASDNPLYLMLVEACRQIFQTSMVIGIERWAETPELGRVQQIHEAIMAAILAGDPVAASQAMTQHFDNAIRVMFGSRPVHERASSEVAG
ncbi:FadR/GntR family transcriptional regulator [Telmatospirillum sp.]|uniref:FadR/GntR family transcriptional regulator n=1 Tax=Telmatospirillum sp. TaxID=2079197 RepID=UPI0028420E4F|nr:FadR/GntR family transcriptional regulator [Telmatospirillum sp.]MDR3435916.1 FadR/GntR family transcriptional regulator [Telmatospirillum sp.]